MEAPELSKRLESTLFELKDIAEEIGRLGGFDNIKPTLSKSPTKAYTDSDIQKLKLIAKEALKTGASVYNLILEKNILSQEEIDEILKPENMTDPREITK